MKKPNCFKPMIKSKTCEKCKNCEYKIDCRNKPLDIPMVWKKGCGKI